MQTLEPTVLPSHLNLVEMAAMLENSQLKSSERRILQQALRESLVNQARIRLHSNKVSSSNQTHCN